MKRYLYSTVLEVELLETTSSQVEAGNYQFVLCQPVNGGKGRRVFQLAQQGAAKPCYQSGEIWGMSLRPGFGGGRQILFTTAGGTRHLIRMSEEAFSQLVR